MQTVCPSRILLNYLLECSGANDFYESGGEDGGDGLGGGLGLLGLGLRSSDVINE